MDSSTGRKTIISGQKIAILAIWLIFTIALLCLVNKYTGLTGQVVFQTNFRDQSTVIKFDNPSQILEYTGNDSLKHVKFFQDKVRFTVQPPVAYQELDISLRFKNVNQGIVLLTPQTKLGLEEVSLPLVVDWLDQLSWEVIDNGTIMLWQKQPRYNSIEEFFINPPEQGLAKVWYQPQVQAIYPESQKMTVPEIALGQEINNPTDEILSQYDFIISTYRPPIKDDQWLVANLALDLTSLFSDDNKFFFSLTAPNRNSMDDAVNLDWLKAKFCKDPFSLGKIFPKL
ncbi:MAG: hypothetical protein V1853_02810 [bacterium]